VTTSPIVAQDGKSLLHKVAGRQHFTFIAKQIVFSHKKYRLYSEDNTRNKEKQMKNLQLL
jgi:hypothetical protein